ncbi:MAG: hypothetical protein Q8P13_01585 [bacterium]|nr:hypothetical protein [bacterium]
MLEIPVAGSSWGGKMAKIDPQRTEKIRSAVRYLLEHGGMVKGVQTKLAEHFKTSRQRVH